MMKRVLAAAVFVGMAGAVWGQDKPLSGPPVKQDRPAGLGGQFAEGKADRKGPMTERVPLKLYADAVAKLRGEDAPEGLRLSKEQDEQITAIEQDFRRVQREFVEKARREGGGGGGGRRPLAGGGKEEVTPEQRARFEELRRSAPSPEDAEVKIYALLTPGQKKFVEGEVQKGRAEMEKRRSEEYMQRELAKRKGDGKAGDQTPAPEKTPAAPEARERFRRIMEKIQQLPPEERDRLLQRLEQELDRRGVDGAGPRRPGAGGGEKKPAPTIDEVKIPPPDKKV